jgi:hypothetical protein
VKLSNIRFYENVFGSSWFVTCGQTGSHTSSCGTFCIKRIQKKNLIVACYLWVLCRIGSNLCGGSSSSSSAFVYQGTCDFHAVEADYEACVRNHSINCHIVQNLSGKKWGHGIAQKNFVLNLSEMIIEQWTSLNIVVSGTDWQICCSYYQILLSGCHILGHKYESRVRIKIWKFLNYLNARKGSALALSIGLSTSMVADLLWPNICSLCCTFVSLFVIFHHKEQLIRFWMCFSEQWTLLQKFINIILAFYSLISCWLYRDVFKFHLEGQALSFSYHN